MSKMSKVVKDERDVKETKRVVNFMGGNSYELNPLDTLKIVSSSSIFGEPQYYRDGAFSSKTATKDAVVGSMSRGFYYKDYIDDAIVSLDKYKGKTTSQVMEDVIDNALEYDYFGTLEWAKRLRKEFLMRLNPQVIMVRAAMSNARKDPKNVEKNPSILSETNAEVMQRADDVLLQLTYFLFVNHGKEKVPNVLKRSWAKKIESLSKYEVYKYRNHEVGLIDAVRISHAHNEIIDELMKNGTIEIEENNKTWETLRSNNMSWADIINTLGRLPHMALLRNLRGIFTEIDNYEKTLEILEDLKNGVKGGKQFPFRYMSAIKAIDSSKDTNNKATIKDALEDCLDISCANLPHLKGNNAFLSDNSGSAWGTFNSEYGSVTIGEIDNLSAVIGAVNSDVGTVFKFGDRLKKFEISKREGVLSQARKISEHGDSDVGGSTENGIWLFFKDAIDNNIHYDNIFIYSDQQAGHGGLYGTSKDAKEYKERGYSYPSSARYSAPYIDVYKLIKDYRAKVNPKVNVYTIQTAGYNNVLIPENSYRTSILYGWTGKELVYADAINKFWDEKDAQTSAKKCSKN